MDIKTAPYHSPYGDYELTAAVRSYAVNKRLAVSLLCREDGYWEPYATLTVNLPEEPLRPNEAFVKCFAENQGLMEFVLENKLGKILPGQEGYSGFCAYPKIAFDMEKLREFDPQGTERYLLQTQQHRQKMRAPRREER